MSLPGSTSNESQNYENLVSEPWSISSI